MIQTKILGGRSQSKLFQKFLVSHPINKSFMTIDKDATEVSTAFQRFYIVPNQLNTNLKIYNNLLSS